MKRTAAHRRKSSERTSNVLALTPELVRSAKEIVSIYDRIEWEQLEEAGCNTVHLDFQSIESAEAASQIMLEMAAGELGRRNLLIERIRQSFQEPTASEGSAEKREGDSVRRSNRIVDQLLADLIAERTPSRFADLAKQAWLLSCRYAGARKKSTASAKAPPVPQIQTSSIPGWLGSNGDRWIGVPARLAFAEPIVGLCRHIARSITGDTTLCLEPGEEDSLRLHHRLWMECKPWSYRVPIDDFSHPICHQLQTFLNAIIPKVRAMVSACIDHRMTPEIATGEKPLPAAATPALERRKASGELVQIVIMPDKAVQIVRGGTKSPVRRVVLRDALRGIAALAEDGKTELHVNHREFVKLTYRNDKKVNAKMDVMRKQLEAVGIHRDKSTGDGESKFIGFQVVFEESAVARKLSSQELKTWLASQPARARAKPVRKG